MLHAATESVDSWLSLGWSNSACSGSMCNMTITMLLKTFDAKPLKVLGLTCVKIFGSIH